MNHTQLARTLGLLTTLVASTAARDAVAGTREIGPSEDAEAAIGALKPGDELVLRGGTYVASGRFSFAITGTADKPIVIRNKDGEKPHINQPSTGQNIVDIDKADYVVIRGIEFSGGSAGLRITSARHLTIEGCEIHDTADVALRANDGGTYESLRILRNHIHDTDGTGEGMYLGCNSNACRVANSLIEGNYIHHTNRPTVAQGDGIELKEGSFGNVIRDNVIHDTNYPCILTYSTVGNGPPNVIERNLMWNCGDHGIQSAADAVIRNNIILGAASDGIAMQPHQAGKPSNLVVVHNTVIKSSNAALSLRGATGSVVIANNALFASKGSAIFVSGGVLGMVKLAGNVGVGGISGIGGSLGPGDIARDFISADYDGAPPIDVFPKAGGALPGAGDAASVPADDFNGTPRGGKPDVGAYAFAASGNPGWPLGPGFKSSTPTPPADGGVADGGGTDGGGAESSGGDAQGSDRGGPTDSADGPGQEGGGGCGCRLSAGDRIPTTGALLQSLLAVAALAWRRSARPSRTGGPRGRRASGCQSE